MVDELQSCSTVPPTDICRDKAIACQHTGNWDADRTRLADGHARTFKQAGDGAVSEAHIDGRLREICNCGNPWASALCRSARLPV